MECVWMSRDAHRHWLCRNKEIKIIYTFANSPRCLLHAAALEKVDKSFSILNANLIDHLNGAIM